MRPGGLRHLLLIHTPNRRGLRSDAGTGCARATRVRPIGAAWRVSHAACDECDQSRPMGGGERPYDCCLFATFCKCGLLAVATLYEFEPQINTQIEEIPSNHVSTPGYKGVKCFEGQFEVNSRSIRGVRIDPPHCPRCVAMRGDVAARRIGIPAAEGDSPAAPL